MGSDFFYRGRLPEVELQEKVIAFVRGYYTRVDVDIHPEPARSFPTVFVSRGERLRRQERFEAECPFNFFGIVPCVFEDEILSHGQFVFDRNDGGRLLRFVKLPVELGGPEHYEEGGGVSEEERRAACVLHEGGYDRVGGNIALATLFEVVKLRWWPGLKVGDDYDACAYVAKLIWQAKLAQTLGDEALDFEACYEHVIAEHKRRQPPPRPVVEPVPDPVLEVDVAAPAELVSNLELGVRASNCLKAAGIRTIRDLLAWTADDLLKVPNMGRRAVGEIREALAAKGIQLREE